MNCPLVEKGGPSSVSSQLQTLGDYHPPRPLHLNFILSSCQIYVVCNAGLAPALWILFRNRAENKARWLARAPMQVGGALLCNAAPPLIQAQAQHSPDGASGSSGEWRCSQPLQEQLAPTKSPRTRIGQGVRGRDPLGGGFVPLVVNNGRLIFNVDQAKAEPGFASTSLGVQPCRRLSCAR